MNLRKLAFTISMALASVCLGETPAPPEKPTPILPGRPDANVVVDEALGADAQDEPLHRCQREGQLDQERHAGSRLASNLDPSPERFDVPAHDWFRGTLRGLLMDTLTPAAVAETGIFNAGAIEGLIRDHMERRVNAGYHLWGLVTLFLWMKRWQVKAQPPEETPHRVPARVFAIS